MISIRQFETTRMYTNTYICFDEDTREGFILDVGECTEDILSYIKRNNIKIRYIILTHGHFDHICGVADFLDLYPNALVIMHKEDIHMISDKTNLAYQNGETVRVQGILLPPTSIIVHRVLKRIRLPCSTSFSPTAPWPY